MMRNTRRSAVAKSGRSIMPGGRSAAKAVVMTATASTLLLAGFGQAATRSAAAASVQAATATAAWRTAKTMPGVSTLNKGGNGAVNSVSCASPGNCSAGGWYLDGSGHDQVFVTSEVNGTWRTAREAPGLAALNNGGKAQVYSVSCASSGNCSAGGYYTNRAGNSQAFVISQVRGTWRSAIEVPGSGKLNQRGNAEVNSVSCASAGNCTAGGSYRDHSHHQQAFTAREVSGRWRTAQELPGAGNLNAGGDASLNSVSCASPGNCSAGGQYVDHSKRGQAFVASEENGTWHAATEVPGTSALNQGGGAFIRSVSCGSAGNCSAGGSYEDSSGQQQVFVVSEVRGSWHSAAEIPGIAALNQGGAAWVYSLSCGSAGNCAAAGSYFAGYSHAFVVSEVNGSWHSAVEIPGTGTLNTGKEAYATSVSCASAGNCSAGGTYTNAAKHMQAFIVSEVKGSWHKAVEAPGTGTLNKGVNAFVQSVSCSAVGRCSAGGGYTDSHGRLQAFVVSES
jgi:hypothetical protein